MATSKGSRQRQGRSPADKGSTIRGDGIAEIERQVGTDNSPDRQRNLEAGVRGHAKQQDRTAEKEPPGA